MTAKNEIRIEAGPATREAFGKALVELGHANPNVVVLDADLSKSTYTAGFAKEFPDRFFRVRDRRSEHGGDRRGPRLGRKDSIRLQLFRVRSEQGFEQLRVTAAFPNVNLKAVRHAQRHLDRRRRAVADEH
jgi:transketolase